ncbi:hypothetical protein ACF0H5_017160 [Mactra antiquata]
MTIGAIVLAAISFYKVGGYESFQMQYQNATPSVRNTNTTCGIPRDDAFNILRDPVNSDMPWVGIILHMLIGCIWYWCNDQVIVQRSLAAKTLQHAKGGSLVCGYLKILTMFVMLIPGMISRVLYPDQVACVDPVECEKYCGNPGGCSNLAYPYLVFGLLPAGLKGLLVAVMLSAIISSLTSIFNSSSTLFTMDLWPRIRKTASEREKLIVGRVFIAIMCVISIFWTPLVRSSQSGQLFLYLNAIQGYLATPIGPLFLFAALWKRTTEPAAFWSLVLTQICGLVRLVLDFVMPAPVCGEPETRPAILYRVHYTYFAVLSLIISTFLLTVISLFTKPKENIEGMTYWTIKSTTDTTDRAQETNGVNLELQTNSLSKPVKTSTEDVNTEDHNVDPDDIGKVKTCIYRICGIPLASPQTFNTEHLETEFKKKFLNEDPFWKKVLDINAAIGLLVVVFLIGYFH